ncbi:GNAT family N-acetyltransferase [Bacillus sp. 1780r2a1]|uniref:GNAT family N-acetyltransferase n=1 Tax=Priestia flexa TaxID=86664 RepID=UPI00220ABB44|nr:GNAT family N-acetyltransferase [Priestia flexa]MDT2046023.1 GNAT family N-acetyltransferase [Priestia flexa]USY53942.1 GNAT family N-acetyltransferase [Bacillus sp. 1780r2a1]
MNIRLLTKEDADIYWELRLTALRDHPESFVLSYEEECEKEVSDIRKQFPTLEDEFIVGGFLDDKLVGIVGYKKQKPLKVQHKGEVWGMYVAPEARGMGLGKSLLKTVVEQASKSKELLQIYLVVAANNPGAKALYTSLGFKSYGFEKQALHVDDKFIDEEHMVLYM